MGSWSEQCDLSGLEIREGDTCYVCLIRKDKHEGIYRVYTPPIKGVYADYGLLAIDSEEDDYRRFWGVSTGTDDDDDMEWRPQDEAGPCFWVSETAYDALSSLIRDFAFSGRDGTIGDDVKKSMGEFRDTIDKAIKQRQRYATLRLGTLRGDQEDILWTYDLVRTCDHTLIDRSELLTWQIKKELALDHFLEGFERAMVLGMGVRELRKCLRPHDMARGPQHGGEKALAGFYETILAEASSRIEEEPEDED